MGAEAGLGWVEEGKGENGDNCNWITIKNYKNKNKMSWEKIGTQTKERHKWELKMDGFDHGRDVKKRFLGDEEWKWKETFPTKQISEGR